MRLLRRILFPLVFVALLFVPVSSAHAEEAPSRTLFIGMSGMTASDIAPSTVAQFAELGSTGITNLHTRTSDPSTCPIDGWMSLRATGDAVDRLGRSSKSPCRQAVDIIPEDGAVVTTDSIKPIPAQVADFDRITKSVDWPTEPKEGVAIGMGAAVTLADGTGFVEKWLPAAEEPLDLQLTILETLLNSEGDIYVDLGWAAGPTDSPERAMNAGWISQRLDAALGAYAAYEKLQAEHGGGANGTNGVGGAGDTDDAVSDGAGASESAEAEASVTEDAGEAAGPAARDQAPAPIDTSIVIASVGQSWDEPSLQFAAIIEPGDSTKTVGLLNSAATKSAGLATISELRDFQAGQDFEISEMALDKALAELQDANVHSHAAKNALTPFFVAWGIFVITGILAGLMHFARRPGPDDGPAFIWRNIATWNTVAFAWIPAALILNFIPWWRFSQSPILPIILTLILAVALTWIARTSPQPVSIIAAITLLLLAVDVVSGTAMQRDGFFGSLTLTSRRFYGISNRSYMILLVSGLLAILPWLANKMSSSRSDAAAGVAAMGVGVLVIDALPMWGADFGGPPGIIAAFLVAFVLISGKRLHWKHLAIWVLLTVLTMGFVGYLDVKSGTPSHIGRFWATIGSPESWQLLAGKARDLAGSFAGNIYVIIAVIVAIMVIVVGTIVIRRGLKHSQTHRQTLQEAASVPGLPAIALAILLGIVIAVPINDSGALMAVDGFAIAVPGLVAILARQLWVSRKRYTANPVSDSKPHASAPSSARDAGEDDAQ